MNIDKFMAEAERKIKLKRNLKKASEVFDDAESYELHILINEITKIRLLLEYQNGLDGLNSDF